MIRIWLAYVAQFLKVRLAYKGDFFAEIAASLLGAGANLAFVLILFERVPSVGGFSRDEVLFVYGFSMIPLGLFSLFSMNLFEFGDRFVMEGQFDRVLLRPLNALPQVLLESVRFSVLADVAVGLAVVVSASRGLSLSFGPLDVAWFVVAAVSGAVIFGSVFTAIASLSFFFEDRIGVSPPVYNMIQFGRWPMPIFGGPVKFVLRFVIPFAFVAFYPSTRFLGRDEFRALCYATPLVAVASALVASVFWRLGVRRYSGTGS